MKEIIKRILLQKLHGVELQNYDIADAVVSNGVKNFFELDFKHLQQDIMQYVKSMEVAPYTYKYASSRKQACLYASIYAVMIEGLLGVLDLRAQSDLKEWADYFNRFQSPNDGLYYDPILVGPAYEHLGEWNEGWGKHHLMGHIIIAFARLGYTPKYPLSYLEKYYDIDYLRQWMDSFDFSENVWTASNYFMNLYTVLEYARDYMNEEKAKKSIEVMLEWIQRKQNPSTGMWHTKRINDLSHLEKLNIVRAAYHFYPLFEYENVEIPFADKIVETILPLQNRWGGWTVENGNSGACEDIDAVEPLIRCVTQCPQHKKEVEIAVRRSMIWQLATKNADNGFSF